MSTGLPGVIGVREMAVRIGVAILLPPPQSFRRLSLPVSIKKTGLLFGFPAGL